MTADELVTALLELNAPHLPVKIRTRDGHLHDLDEALRDGNSFGEWIEIG